MGTGQGRLRSGPISACSLGDVAIMFRDIKESFMLQLSVEEQVARARADLRIGAPVALVAETGGALILAAETARAQRLEDFRRLGQDGVDLAISHRRAETLAARAYDGDIARIIVPTDADIGWNKATAEASLYLERPLRGPYRTRRDGDADMNPLGILL